MPAPSSATIEGSMCSTGWAMNAANTSDEDDSALDEQPRIADGLAFLERHDVGDPFGIDVERAAEQARQHGDEDDHDDDHDRRHVDEKVVERQARPAGDDDVGRIADQGRRAADVGGEHLGDQERHRR